MIVPSGQTSVPWNTDSPDGFTVMYSVSWAVPEIAPAHSTTLSKTRNWTEPACRNETRIALESTNVPDPEVGGPEADADTGRAAHVTPAATAESKRPVLMSLSLSPHESSPGLACRNPKP